MKKAVLHEVVRETTGSIRRSRDRMTCRCGTSETGTQTARNQIAAAIANWDRSSRYLHPEARIKA